MDTRLRKTRTFAAIIIACFLILVIDAYRPVEKIFPATAFEVNTYPEVSIAQPGPRCSDYSWSQPMGGSAQGSTPIEAHQACLQVLNTQFRTLQSMCINFCNGAGCRADLQAEFMCPVPLREPYISHGEGTFTCTCK